LKNSIIIFDEAHNVVCFLFKSTSFVEYKLIGALKERICEDSASAEINSTGNFINIIALSIKQFYPKKNLLFQILQVQWAK
jgi:hypothetical protein